MGDSRLLDPVDMRILDLLRQTPAITQTRIAKELGVSQPWIAARIKHLEQKGIVTMSMGVNLERLGLAVGVVSLSTKNPYRLLRKYRCCPYFLRGSILSGASNVSLDFCGEDASSLQGIVDQHIRKEPDISGVDFRLITHTVDGLAVCPRLVLDRKEESPCGTRCEDCLQYESGSCVGCPATIYYRGRFWSGNNRRHELEAPLM
ncbi:MAG: Lrp/AsnC family transcriptional regulator [Conexivisphaerales archaeon]